MLGPPGVFPPMERQAPIRELSIGLQLELQDVMAILYSYAGGIARKLLDMANYVASLGELCEVLAAAHRRWSLADGEVEELQAAAVRLLWLHVASSGSRLPR